MTKLQVLFAATLLLGGVNRLSAELVGFDNLASSFGFDINGNLVCNGTPVTNQYQAQGVTFGSLCVADAANDLAGIPAKSSPNVVAVLDNLAQITFTVSVDSVLIYANHF